MIVDRLSALPDSIIHYIFSFLDTRDFVQTSILSNRWRHLWESTPYLKFHQEFYPSAAFTFHQPSSSECKSSLNVFTDFVDRVLILREAFGINKFQLFCDEQLDARRLYTWLLGALRRHAQVISLDLCIDQPLDLPQHLFTSRVSTLEIYNNLFEVPIRMPESMCSASRIKSLKLVGVELPDGNLEGELVLNCSVLEASSLIECDHSHLKLFTISAPSLKKLKLHTQYLERLEPCVVQLCCPKLVSFELTACMCNNCSITNMSSLDSAYINSCENIEKQYDDCLAKVLRGISNVRSLRMSTAVVKYNGRLRRRFQDRFSLRGRETDHILLRDISECEWILSPDDEIVLDDDERTRRLIEEVEELDNIGQRTRSRTARAREQMQSRELVDEPEDDETLNQDDEESGDDEDLFATDILEVN